MEDKDELVEEDATMESSNVGTKDGGGRNADREVRRCDRDERMFNKDEGILGSKWRRRRKMPSSGKTENVEG